MICYETADNIAVRLPCTTGDYIADDRDWQCHLSNGRALTGWGRLVAGCGLLTDNVYIIDNGDGTCGLAGTANGVAIGGACSKPLFPGFSTCPSLNTSLTLIFRKTFATAPYNGSMQGWLDKVGIGTPRLISGVLTIYIDHSPNPLPAINPVFLQGMQQVRFAAVLGGFDVLLWGGGCFLPPSST